MFSLLSKEKKGQLKGKFDKLRKKLEVIDHNPSFYHQRAMFGEGRKSINVCQTVIKHLTEDGDKILDPCFGSGTFLIASALENRIGLGVELDNFTFNFFNIMLKKLDKKEINNYFEKIKENCYKDIMDLYETRCECGKINYISRLYYDPENEEYFNPKNHRNIGENGENIKFVHTCDCGKKAKVFSDFDMHKINEIKNLNVDEFPSHKLIPNPRINITPSSGNDSYDRNFNNRAKKSLLTIQKEINKLPDTIEKEFMQFVLVNTLVLSRITMYGSSSNYIYRVLKNKAQESNVWVQFKRKFEYMMKFKFEKELENIQQKNINSKNKDNLIRIINKDCKSISLKDFNLEEKVDMIYTDPPYTDQNPYLERHQLFRDWLFEFYSDAYKLSEIDLKNEIVVSDSPLRTEKDADKYFEDIQKMFNSSYSMLKDYGLMVLDLNLASRNWLEVYNKFKNHARAEGFEPIFRYDIKNNDPTIRRQSAQVNTSSMEIVLFLIKLTEKERFWYIDDINLDRDLYFVIKEFLHDNSGLTQTTNYVIIKCQDYLNNNGLELEARNIKKIRNVIFKYFIVDRGQVYIDDDMILFEDYTKEAVLKRIIDLTPVIIKNLLETQGSFLKDDLLMNLSYKLDNGNKQAIDEIISNRKIINQILNALCMQTEDGYYPKDFSKVNMVRESENNKSIDIATLEGEEFEDVIVSLLKREGYNDVLKSPRTGDRGVDIYAKKNGNNYIYQVKRWIHKVGGTVIQRLHSMRENNNFKYAVCITTSDYTNAAIAEAEASGVSMINGRQIIERLNIAFPDSYYHSLLDLNN